MENVAFTRAQWLRYSENLYPDKLAANRYLDLFLVSFCSLVSFINKNLLNLGFLGRKSLISKQIYLNFIGHEMSSSKQVIPRGSHIRIHNRNDLIYTGALVSYFFFGARYLIAFYINSNLSPHHLKVSILRGISGFAQDTSVSISTSQLGQQLVGLDTRREEGDRCSLSKDKFLEFVMERYGGFRLWNHTASFTGQHPRSHFSDWILVESHCSLQVYTDEVKMLGLVVGLFTLVVGLVSCLANSFRPFDIPSMAFAYMPEFIAFQLHTKINFYLDSIRTSYINFWAARQVDLSGKLVHLVKGRAPSTRCLGDLQQRRLVVDSLSLSYQQFRTYLPAVRGRAWRRILLVLQPMVFLFACVNLLLNVMFIFYYYVGLNAGTIELNKELKSGLASAHLAELSSWRGLMEADKADRCSQVELQQQFRHLLVASLGKILATSVNFEQNETTTEGLIEAISPDELLAPSRWLVVWLGTLSIALLASSYFAIYLAQMGDLCFWLAEIQTKLSVGAIVLRHYNLSDQDADWRLAGGRRLRSLNSSRRQQRGRSLVAQPADESHYSLSLGEILTCFFASWSARMRLCERHALRLAELDGRGSSALGLRRASHHFLVAAYLDLRLFEAEIDKSRPNMNALISFVVFEALNILVGASLLNDFALKMGLVAFCLLLVSAVLMLASFFQSQCSKLHNPIHSILAASGRGDKRAHHLALLWRKYLPDLTGAHSKFGFKVYSVTISYAATLQFCFSLASVFILMSDMAPVRR